MGPRSPWVRRCCAASPCILSLRWSLATPTSTLAALLPPWQYAALNADDAFCGLVLLTFCCWMPQPEKEGTLELSLSCEESERRGCATG